MVEFKKILEFLIYILKMFIYFDTKFIKYQSGGGNNDGGEQEEEKEEEEKDATDEASEDAGSAGFLWIITFIKEILMGVLKFFGDKITNLMSMLLFASIAPIIPFFVSMAGLYGVFKYLIYKVRRI
jgi:hypothetical protein